MTSRRPSDTRRGTPELSRNTKSPDNGGLETEEADEEERLRLWLTLACIDRGDRLEKIREAGSSVDPDEEARLTAEMAELTTWFFIDRKKLTQAFADEFEEGVYKELQEKGVPFLQIKERVGRALKFLRKPGRPVTIRPLAVRALAIKIATPHRTWKEIAQSLPGCPDWQSLRQTVIRLKRVLKDYHVLPV